MSFGIDVNVLLHASDESSALHDKASGFLSSCAHGREVFCIAWLTVMSYLRIATHASIFQRPLAPAEAMQNIEALLSLPHCRPIGEEEGFLNVYHGITREVPARGNLVPDAHLSAVLSQHGIVTLYTHDRDFRKFDFLDVRDPLDIDDDVLAAAKELSRPGTEARLGILPHHADWLRAHHVAARVPGRSARSGDRLAARRGVRAPGPSVLA